MDLLSRLLALALVLCALSAPAFSFSDIEHVIRSGSDIFVNYTQTVAVTYEDNPAIGGSPPSPAGLAAPALNALPALGPDGFCSQPGWSIVTVGQPFKLGSLTVRLAGVWPWGRWPAGFPVRPDDNRPARFGVWDAYNQSLGEYALYPGENLSILDPVSNRSETLKLYRADPMDLASQWAEVWGRVADCSQAYQDVYLVAPLVAARADGTSIATSPSAHVQTGAAGETASPVSDAESPSTAAIPLDAPAPANSDASGSSAGSFGSGADGQAPSGQAVALPSPASKRAALPAGGSDATEKTGEPASGEAPSASTVPPASVPSPATEYGRPPSSGAEREPDASLAASASVPASSSPELPWWMAPALVAALGAFFMAVMVFYYRSPSVFAPAPPSQTEAQPIYLSDSRLALMQELSQTERIPTDIALRLNKSKSTVVEQLDELCAMGLVERLAQPGRKFVFYRLSRSGRNVLLQANEQKRSTPPMQG